MNQENKKDTYKFKTNIAVDVLFQSNIIKEGVSKYGKWIMYEIQVEGKDYVFFPSEGLRKILKSVEGEIKGRKLNIGKYESDNNMTYWQVFDEDENEIERCEDKEEEKEPKEKSGSSNSSDKELREKINGLDIRIGVLEMEVKEINKFLKG
jgi:hypothetical protein